MSHPLQGGWRVAGCWLPKLTTLFADGLAILIATLALFAGGVTSQGEDLPQNVVLDFTASWCQPCQQMSPIVHRLVQQGYSIRKVDVDQHKRLAQSFKIEFMPTFVLIVDGEERSRVTGKISEQQLRKMAQQATPPAKQPETVVAAAEPVQSVPLPVTPRENRTLAAEAEVTPFQPDLGEPKVSPESQPMVAETKERRRLFDKFNLLKRRPKREKSEITNVSATDEVRAIRAQNGEIEGSPNEAIPQDPMLSSVRLRVTDSSGVNLGSGTIIDSRAGRTTIITCGHIFGSRNESSKTPKRSLKVDVDLFLAAGGHETYVGKVVDFDLNADVGVITITTSGTLPVSPLAPLAQVPVVEDRVLSIGCGGGEGPSQVPVQVTAINRYDGPDTIECTGVPVQGRSGGGLFDAQGQLVGICFGADQEGQRGVYASLRPIYEVLTRAGLQQVLPQNPPENSKTTDPEVETKTTQTIAEAEPVIENATPQDANFAEAFRELDHELFADETPPTSDQLAKLFEESPEAEVICIVRSKQGGKDRMVILNQASPKFVSYLLESVDTKRSTAPRTASLRVEDAEERFGGDWEQDDSIGVPKQATDQSRPTQSVSAKAAVTSRSRFGSRSAN